MKTTEDNVMGMVALLDAGRELAITQGGFGTAGLHYAASLTIRALWDELHPGESQRDAPAEGETPRRNKGGRPRKERPAEGAALAAPHTDGGEGMQSTAAAMATVLAPGVDGAPAPAEVPAP